MIRASNSVNYLRRRSKNIGYFCANLANLLLDAKFFFWHVKKQNRLKYACSKEKKFLAYIWWYFFSFFLTNFFFMLKQLAQSLKHHTQDSLTYISNCHEIIFVQKWAQGCVIIFFLHFWPHGWSHHTTNTWKTFNLICVIYIVHLFKDWNKCCKSRKYFFQ